MTVRKPRPRNASTTTAAEQTTTKAPGTARTRKTTKTAPAATSGTRRKKAPAKPTANVGNGSGFLGYSPGSASEIAAVAMVKGGTSRQEIIKALEAADVEVNEGDVLTKSWSVTSSTVLTRLVDAGWTVEGVFRVVPPEGIDVDVPEPDGIYMPKRDPNQPRRGRRRREEVEAAAAAAKSTRPAAARKAKTSTTGTTAGTKAAPKKPVRRARKAAA